MTGYVQPLFRVGISRSFFERYLVLSFTYSELPIKTSFIDMQESTEVLLNVLKLHAISSGI